MAAVAQCPPQLYTFFHLYNVIFTSINNVSSANHVRQRGFTEYQAEFTNYKRILGLSLRWLPELFTWLFTLDTSEKTPAGETGETSRDPGEIKETTAPSSAS